MRNTLLTTGIAIALTVPAMARPPANAVPLSEILATLEQSEDLLYFDEVEWDGDGYWEVEYYRPDGAKVKIKIDPVTGQPI